MKLIRIASVAALSLVATSALAAQSKPRTENDKLSYTIGADLGKNFKKQGIEINSEYLRQGMDDAQSGKLKMTQKQMDTTLKAFQTSLLQKKEQAFQSAALKNKAEGANFLEKNKAKDGVVTLPSGLQYKVLTAGTGAKPGPEDSVTVEYTGRLLDGKVFDSTDRTGRPVSFKVSEVIPGWTEALQLMPKGSTWEVYVPANLAYGERGIGGPIGPNETLIFKIHLIDIKKS